MFLYKWGRCKVFNYCSLNIVVGFFYSLTNYLYILLFLLHLSIPGPSIVLCIVIIVIFQLKRPPIYAFHCYTNFLPIAIVLSFEFMHLSEEHVFYPNFFFKVLWAQLSGLYIVVLQYLHVSH